MELKLMKNAVNQVGKGTVIYNKDNDIDSVCIILKGRVLAVSDGTKMLLGSGSFFGVSDFFMGRFLNSYIAYDDVTFYCFSLLQKEELDAAFMSNKDYKGLAVQSLIKQINQLYDTYHSLHQRTDMVYDFILESYERYTTTSNRLGYQVKGIPMISEITPYTSEFTINEKQYLYYKDFDKISLDLIKHICGVGNSITPYYIETISAHIIQLHEECVDMANYIGELFPFLISQEESCLYKNYASLAISVEEAGGNNREIMDVIDSIIDQINDTEKLFEEKTGQSVAVDREHMEEIYYMLLSKSSNRKEHVNNNFTYTQNEMEEVRENLKDSIDIILNYTSLSGEWKDVFKNLIGDYVNLKDKYSAEDSARSLRRRISEQFYELYGAVFFQAYGQIKIPKSVDLFLKYGFLSEKFLNESQLRELYYLEDNKKEDMLCSVYNIKDWLTLIYEGRKEPSKNDFDLDYYEMLRDRRKRGDITEKEELSLKDDASNKVLYEINNMFRYNNRLANGAISTFIPFLYGDSIIQSIKRLYVNSSQIDKVIKEIIKIDYSLFYRERMYVDNEKGIEKEYIMEEIFPDIILLPTVGVNGIMWQEISGRRKSSQGRFLFPIFSDVSIYDSMLKVCGRFRWELCRSIQGTAWNNIKYKSLTSEYADYLQFYRKNRELTEEAKERLKSQIQKGKGNYREVFVIDYETWIKGESSGALRLNRIVREMLATYCPFSKPVRERIVGQPLFSEAYTRFTREQMKKVRELETRHRALEKNGVNITKELKDTLKFYKEF